ncbi:MAG: ABC transporter permease [Chloroflexota bacterium]
MQTYIIRRVLLMIPSVFLITIILFISLRFIPGNVIDLMVAEMATESGMGQQLTADYIKHKLGMDVPIYVQYGKWLGAAVQGDLGRSLWTDREVTEEISSRLPISIELGVMALITAVLIALPIGIYSAIRQDTWGDYVGRTIAILAISLPSFWLGTIVIVYPSIWWGWSPPMEYIPFAKDPMGNLGQFLLPAVILGMVLSGNTMRMTRTMMLEVLRQDYIRTAWAKGLTERTIIFRHALKNALIPVITIVGIQLGILIGGSVVLEQIFVLPGVGRLLIEALNKRDYPVISGINVVLSIFVLFMNLIVDLMYGYLDPRVRYE